MHSGYALIADHEVVAAHVFLAAVREIGLATVTARDGASALAALLERGAPALLVAELALPGVDGFELIEGLRRTVPEASTRVVVVSADRGLRDRAADARVKLGIGAILARAASEDSVRRVIRRLLAVPERPSMRPPPGRHAREGALRARRS